MCAMVVIAIARQNVFWKLSLVMNKGIRDDRTSLAMTHM